MAIFDLGMEPKEVNLNITKSVIKWCSETNPQWNARLFGEAIAFDSAGKTENEVRSIQALLGTISIVQARQLGYSLRIE